MMPSVIPARLQFQCGHAALVTLPRVKGETATQRNGRVAREKTAALTRQCDFCAPSVAVLEPPSTVVDIAHVELAVSDVVDPTPVADLTVVVTNVSDTPSSTEELPSEDDAEPVPTPAEATLTEVVEIEPEPAGSEAPQEEVVVEEVIVVPDIEPPADEATDEAPVPVVEAPEPETRPVRKPRARRQPAPVAPTPAPARTRRVPRGRVPAPASTGHRFVVEYQVERVIRAVSIRDALRQATALGATDLIAITRAD